MFPVASGFTSPYFLLLVGCLCLIVVVAVGVWRQRPSAGATALVGLLAALFVWGGVYAIGLVTHDPTRRLLLERLLWIGVTTVPVAWFLFAASYTGRRRLTTPGAAAGLLVVPAVVTVLVLTNPQHQLVWLTNEQVTERGVSVARQTFGPVALVYIVYGYGLVLAGAALLVKLVVTTEGLYPDQSLALVVGSVTPLVANGFSVLGVAPIPGLDMTPYAFTVSGVAFGYALVRYDLFEFVPATRYLGRDAVIDNMDDPVFILDDERRVVETNPVATAVFDVDRETVLGEPLSAVLDSEDATLPDAGERREITIDRHNRVFEVRKSSLSNWQGRTVGSILVFRDVTERTLREQRTEVLNRVLRHNLRNDLMVINGHAAALDDRGRESGDHTAEIRETAAELLDVAEKARVVDQLLGETEESSSTVDMTGATAALTGDVQERFPAVAVETDLDDGVTLTCQNPRLVDAIVENLVENAAEHNDSANPRVTVSLAAADEVLTLAVADNGPPIPQQERELLDADGETSLRHSSGLGLWTVNWCVRRLGGDLAIESADDGNTVTVTLPQTAVWEPTGKEPAAGNRG